MPRILFPGRLERPPKSPCLQRTCAAHRAWVRRHHCSVPGCHRWPIECAHVRSGTDGGTGLKPSDKWTLSLCTHHHIEQHRLGEQSFESHYGIDLVEVAREFARRSPHRHKLAQMCAEEED